MYVFFVYYGFSDYYQIIREGFCVLFYDTKMLHEAQNIPRQTNQKRLTDVTKRNFQYLISQMQG
jgi:hypothetical protein